MVGPSTSDVVTELEKIQVLSEVSDNENVDEFSLDNGSIFDSDYTQLVTPGTHVISGSESIMAVMANKTKM
jgi:hypothetical protein